MKKTAAPTLKSFEAFGSWMDAVPPRPQKPNTPNPELVEPLKAVMAIPRATLIMARRARLDAAQSAPEASRAAPTL